MNRVGKFGLSFFMVFVANAGCESDDYLAPRREPLKLEPLDGGGLPKTMSSQNGRMDTRLLSRSGIRA